MIQTKEKLCKCGCGISVTINIKGMFNDYLHGHNRPWKNKQHSEQTKNKIRKSLTGRIVSAEVKKKISDSMLGENNHFYGKTHSRKIKQEHSHRMSGVNHPFYGLKGKEHHNYKRNVSDETRIKQSLSQRGDKGSNWRGGITKHKYGAGFNNLLKEKIRARDNNHCQYCGKRKYKRELDVHHIDYNKKNNEKTNLISLCGSCHMKTNCGNRDEWTAHFKLKFVGVSA